VAPIATAGGGAQAAISDFALPLCKNRRGLWKKRFFGYSMCMTDIQKNQTETTAAPETEGAARIDVAAGERQTGPGGVAKQREAERKARAALKLRENLQRRKQQARARRAGEADETIGLPAAKTDESC
jgi:hypothetical protein